MNYEQKYKEALERMKSWVRGEHPECFSEAQKAAEFIFPELKESEDERMLREIKEYIKEQGDKATGLPNGTVAVSDMIAWLEKQGKKPQGKSALEVWKDMRLEVYQQASGNRHEPNYSDDTTKMFSLNDIDEIIEKISEQTHAELGQSEVTQTSDQELEPKFHPGDWITHNTANFVFKIINVGSNGYEVVNRENYKKTISYDNEGNYHLWTIADAKDGDVLDANGAPFIYKNQDKDYVYFYCGINLGGYFIEANGIDTWDSNNKIYPATKEQRDTLIKAMANAGYTFDFDKKELKKVEIEKLNADKVIEWLRQNTCAACWDNPDEGISQGIEQFKKDFKL